MKGARLNILVLIAMTLIGTLILVIASGEPSWSQTALTAYIPIFNIAIMAIIISFFFRDANHTVRNFVLFRIRKMEVRRKHLSRFTGYSIMGVLATPVTYDQVFTQADNIWATIIVNLHYIFTGIGILSAFVQFYFYHKKIAGLSLSMTKVWFTIIVGLVGFALGFFSSVYTTGVGELIAAVCVAHFVFQDISNIRP